MNEIGRRRLVAQLGRMAEEARAKSDFLTAAIFSAAVNEISNLHATCVALESECRRLRETGAKLEPGVAN